MTSVRECRGYWARSDSASFYKQDFTTTTAATTTTTTTNNSLWISCTMKRKFESRETDNVIDEKSSRSSRLTVNDSGNGSDVGLRKSYNLCRSFSTYPITTFEKKFPYFRKPVEFGAFSLGIDRNFKDSREKLRLYSPPQLKAGGQGLDLNIGFETFVGRSEDEPERLDHLLAWINLHREKFRTSSDAKDCNLKCLNTDFITWRGHLVKILCTPYEKRDPWRLDVCKYNGTIFICEVETEVHKNQRLNESNRQKRMCYWGYKFEDYMTKSLSGKDTTVNELKVINNSEAFCSVVRSRLNEHSLLFGAEVDCCTLIDGKVVPSHSYIELKTSRVMDNARLYKNFASFKLIKYWAQSYLAGVPKVVCGLRNDDGIVQKIETYDTLKIPDIAFMNNATWNASVCMNFCNEFLSWIKSVVTEDDKNVVYSFVFQEPFRTVEVAKNPYGSEVFLPEWF